MLKKVQKGDNLRQVLTASNINTVVDAVNILDPSARFGSALTPAGSASASGQVTVTIYNGTGAPLPAGSPVYLYPGKTPTADDPEAIMEAKTPDTTEEDPIVAVTLNDLDPLEVGKAVISGTALAMVNITSINHKYAEITQNGFFTSTPDKTQYRILSARNTGTNALALILLSTTSAPSAPTYKGMFTIIQTENGYKVIDTTQPTSQYAGIAHVNNQPYTVPAITKPTPAIPTVYIYLNFSAGNTYALAADSLEIQNNAPGNNTPNCTIEEYPGLQNSDYLNSYHLIGRIHTRKENGANFITAISQDHIPGNLYMMWYAPNLGILEDWSLKQ